jgi:hypothetical protein
MAAGRHAARQFGLPASTVRAIDLDIWSAGMRRGKEPAHFAGET